MNKEILERDLKLDIFKEHIAEKNNAMLMYNTKTSICKKYPFNIILDENYIPKDEDEANDISWIRFCLYRYINFVNGLKKKDKDEYVSLDCDSTKPVASIYNKEELFLDTYYSVQSILREILKLLPNSKPSNSVWVLNNLERIKSELSKVKVEIDGKKEDLYSIYAKFICKYHTIPNIGPCPFKKNEYTFDSYNQLKGKFNMDENISYFFDRPDIFLNYIKGDNHPLIADDEVEYILDWFDKNKALYDLDIFLDAKLDLEVAIPKSFEDKENIEKHILQIDKIMKVIDLRKDRLLSK